MFISHFPTQVRRKFQSGGHGAEVMNVMRLDGLEKKKSSNNYIAFQTNATT